MAPQPFFEDRGTPIAVRQVVESLCRIGYRVDLLTFPTGRDVDIPGARIWRTRNTFGFRHVPIGFSLRKILLDLELIVLLRNRLRQERYGCVHAVEEAAFPAVWLGRRRGLPVIYDMQSSLPEQLTKYRLFRFKPVAAVLRTCEKWLLRNASFVVSSAGLRDQVSGDAPQTRVDEWMFTATHTDATRAEIARVRAELNAPADARLVVYTGSFEQYQGLPDILAAIPTVCTSDPRVVFVLVGGKGERHAEIQQWAQRLGLNGNLRVVPRQPRDRMPIYLQMADVLVSPRAYGGNLPLKIFDYLAAGRPIVATDLPSHRAVLNERLALLVPPGPDGIAAGISTLLREPDRAARLAEAARQYARTHLGPDAFERRIQHLYDQVCRDD